MKLMINGLWRGDIDPTPELKAQQMIHAGRFRDRISADSASGFRAEPGRYHLYASPACPFSHRVLIVRPSHISPERLAPYVIQPKYDNFDTSELELTVEPKLDGDAVGVSRVERKDRQRDRRATHVSAGP